MNWSLYIWTFRLKSPLHVGFHKVMHFFSTRPYVPGKLFWGSLTAKLTPMLGINDYQKVGEFLKKAIRFGYLYPYVEEKLYCPIYTEDGLRFGSLSQNEFEKKFISSMASAAIEAESLASEEGMLHEVEFISPYTIDDEKPVFIRGFVWIREFTENRFKLSKNNNKLIITHNGQVVDFKNSLANRFQIGGERKYGFGLLKLNKLDEVSSNEFNGLSGKWCEKDGEVCISINSDNPIWSHVLCSNNINIKGNIEPLVGRDWESDKGAGRRLTSYGLFWSPGSILCEDKTFKITEFGIWEAVD
ncbi:MAG: hypothetical protein H5T85_04020 [Actinobacteria bacterium]|nr:hypothetical protein [Actinomycetota bacterium]